MSETIVGRLRNYIPGENSDCIAEVNEIAAAEIERLTRERDEASDYLRGLLVSYVTEHCDPIPEWKPLPDLIGMLTQIDNASTVTREFKARALASESRELKAVKALDLLEGGQQLLLAAVKAGDPPNEIIWRIEEELRQIAMSRAIRASDPPPEHSTR